MNNKEKTEKALIEFKARGLAKNLYAISGVSVCLYIINIFTQAPVSLNMLIGIVFLFYFVNKSVKNDVQIKDLKNKYGFEN